MEYTTRGRLLPWKQIKAPIFEIADSRRKPEAEQMA
jgi:hypothetical protein